MTDQTTNTTSESPHANGRERFAAATLWLPVVAISITATLWFDQLPDVLPKQWSGTEVTSTIASEALIGITGGIALLGAIVGLVALSDAAADFRRNLVLAAGCGAGLAAGIWFVCAGLVLVTGSPEPDAGGWPLLGVAAGAYGLIPFALSPKRGLEVEGSETVPVQLEASERGAWFTTVRVPVFVWLAALAAVSAVGTAVFGITQGAPASRPTTIVLLLVTVLGLAFARIRVSVDRRGLRVVSSLLRVPLKRIPLAEIVSARGEAIRASEWGGWGYRIMPGRSALVLTGSRGLVVKRRNDTVFAVTLPEPELPAALLTTLAARSRPGETAVPAS